MLKNIHFPNQKPDEKILYLLRRHWLIALWLIVRYSFWLLLPIFLYGLFFYIWPLLGANISQFPWSAPIFALGLSLYYLVVWIFFWHAWIDYYLDVWIITDKRIVNIEQRGLFSRTISEIKLFRVQDVQAEVHGLLPTFFHFGEVTIQTAGNETFSIFKQVPHPYEISQHISKLVEFEKKHHHPLPEEIETNKEKPEANHNTHGSKKL